MPTNSTPCYDKNCRYFIELYSPMPGESWNRCSHKKRRFPEKDTQKRNIIYGYGDHICKYYKRSPIKMLLKAIKACIPNF